MVWNARVSEAGSPELREEVRRSLQFFGRDELRVSLPTVRERVSQSMTRLFRNGGDGRGRSSNRCGTASAWSRSPCASA
ncbi:hypothetical protein ACQPW3_33145 [Actinosynnema sp. CA-248983]